VVVGKDCGVWVPETLRGRALLFGVPTGFGLGRGIAGDQFRIAPSCCFPGWQRALGAAKPFNFRHQNGGR